MSDQNDDKPLPGRTSNGKSQFMNGGKLAVAPTGAFFVTPPAQFRMALCPCWPVRSASWPA